MTPHEPTILIIGAGTFGVSTAYHLAQQQQQQTPHIKPSNITIIDRAAAPPHPAAAVDTSRIIRADYANPLYCTLANEALHAWFWSPELGPCFHKVGWLLLDDGDDEAGSSSSRTQRVHATLRARGTHIMQDVPLADADADAGLNRRWRGVMAGTDTRGFASAYFNPDAGWADAAGATARFLGTAVRRGVRREVGDVVELLVDCDTGRVNGARTADGRVFCADQVVLAAGAWTSALVAPLEEALGLGPATRVERQARAMAVVSAYYRVDDEGVERMVDGGMPCVVYGRVGEVVPPWRDGGLLKYTHAAARVVNTVRAGTWRGGAISVPPTGRDQRVVPAGLKREMEAGLTSRLTPEFARGAPEYWRLCWDSCTPTDDLLLCEHPRMGGLFIITGGSFCGYKFLPNIGKYMVKVLQGQSNGAEKDKAWGWKTEAELSSVSVPAHRELSDYGDLGSTSRL